MRIVGGTFRGRQLASPEYEGVRPTTDRVRESVFNILVHGIEGFALPRARVIDLFAGTGAMGLEAISRGAGYCLFVEESADSRALIRRNIEAFGLTGVTRIFRRDATDLGPSAQMGKFDLAFLDPPYGLGLGERALASLISGGWLAAGAVIAVEERKGMRPVLPDRLKAFDLRAYGDTEITFARAAG
ncbi:MAG: 16S rRNA (guanine(966)-N(2))-methyltransferase RsmD [Beijerinckiaceae bacterium]|nr:16S rRNA (guanine(966)-N(2))-methyltransferase RsmD [Beijerinckiaceae bacterium]